MKIINSLACVFFGGQCFIGENIHIDREQGNHVLKHALLIEEDEYDYSCTLIGDMIFPLNMCAAAKLNSKSEFVGVYNDYFEEVEEIEEED